MHFYALRIVCQSCDSPFVVGGSAQNDLTLWRQSVVECQYCGAETLAAAGATVCLGSQAASVETPQGELCQV